MIPAIVGRSKLMQANSLFYLTFTASQLLGLVFFGPLIVKVLGDISFFAIMAALPKLLVGDMMADMTPTFGSVNMIGGELDR